MDLSYSDSINKYVSSLNENINILVNNAGINELIGLDGITDEKIHDMIQVNLISQLQLIKNISFNEKK